LPPGCEPFAAADVPEALPDVWGSAVPADDIPEPVVDDLPAACEPVVAEQSAEPVFPPSAEAIASAEAVWQSPAAAAPLTPDQHIAEALLEAYEGWRAERDAMKLERRLWGIINFSKGQ
jgi:hypothetical protein